MTDPRGGSPDAQAAARVVVETVPGVMRAIRARMRAGRPTGVSVPQFRALLFIRRNPGTGLSGVADHLGSSLPAASELVARLVSGGLVERTVDPDSRRRIRLELTGDGAHTLAVAEAGTLEWLAARLADARPEALATIASALADLGALVEASGVGDDGQRGGPGTTRPGHRARAVIGGRRR